MRAYITTDLAEEYAVAFVADTAREARNMAIGHDVLSDLDFVDIRIKWLKGIDIAGLPKGEIGVMEGLKRGAYAYIFGLPCPHCGADEPDLKIYPEFCERCESGADISEHRVSVSDASDLRGGCE